MNAVFIAVTLMLTLSVLRIPVVASIMLASVAGGLAASMPLTEVFQSFDAGITKGAGIALNYAVLGAFAAAIAHSGVAQVFSNKASGLLTKGNTGKWLLLAALLLAAMASQNLVPIHIAFIPLLLPPLLLLMAKLKLDRRAVACLLTFGLVTTYMTLPVGFGAIYLEDILIGNLRDNGLTDITNEAARVMWMPAVGMLAGLAVALLWTYRKPREYDESKLEEVESPAAEFRPKTLWAALIAIVMAFVVQLTTGSMAAGALLGFSVFTISGVIPWKQADGVFVDGMKMMASIGFIMIAAAGFAQVLRDSGHIPMLVETSTMLIGNSQAMGALLMLLVGLLITMGVGSSFSTVPIIAALYVPLGMELGFSIEAIVILVGTAGVLGDAGSPASDSTLGPTAGLNIDGQHDHIRDTVIPTFMHFNLPLLISGWVAAVLLS